MKEQLIAFFTHFHWPPEVVTFLMAVMPVLEARAAIPVGHGVLGLSWFSSFFWSYAGSLFPGIVILLAVEPALSWCNRKSPFCKRVLGAALDHARKHYQKHHERFGEAALFIVASLPLPLFGVWTGSLGAVVFGVPLKRALILLAMGNAVACLLVTLASAGIFRIAGSVV